MDIKNVLQISWNCQGGARQIVESLQRALHDRNISSDIVYDNYHVPPICSMEEGYISCSSWEDLIKKIDVSKYDVIHSHTCTLPEYDISLLKSKSKAPLVYTTHSLIIHDNLMWPKNTDYRDWFYSQPEHIKRSEINKRLKTMPYVPMQETMFRYSDKIIQLTNFARSLLGYYYPKFFDKSVVIPNGSDFYKFYDDKDVNRMKNDIISQLGDNRKTIIFPGRLSLEKGVLDLADAFNIIKKERPSSRLIYVGDGVKPFTSNFQDPREAILQRIDPLHRNSVIFTGWIGSKKRMAAYYKAANVTVVPSYYESFGLSGLESMMMETPVVMSDVDGPHEAFIEPLLAYGIQPRHPEHIVQWISWLFNNPTQAKINASLVRQAAIEKYSLDRMTDMTVNLYNEALVENS